MNLHIINVIIGREYLTRVKKKSFLLITFLGPLFFAAIAVLPSIIMYATKEETKKIAVVDKSAIVLPYLVSDSTAIYSDYSLMDADSVKSRLNVLGMDALLEVSAMDSASKSVSVVSYSKKPLGMDLVRSIEKSVNNSVEDYRIKSYRIENLDKIMEDVKSDLKVTTYTLDDEGDAKISASEVYMIISMILGMIIYIFITMFSGMVMSSVIEEKSSRVVEVLVSSVKATELMFGKIVGVAFVAMTQFVLWILLTVIIVFAVTNIMGADFFVQASAQVSDPDMAVMGAQMTEIARPQSEMAAIISTLSSLNYVRIILSFIVYFLFGYLLYSSLFAAIGSAVENEADTQQLSIPITIPLMIGFFIAIYAFKAPDSGIVFWGSMIPFTSPIVMLARIPFGVPAWQLAMSLALLVGTFVLCAWASAKIYTIGILMFGKKSTFKDLWKWLKLK